MPVIERWVEEMVVHVSAARTALAIAGHGHALTAEGTNWGEARHPGCRVCLALIDLDGALSIYRNNAS